MTSVHRCSVAVRSERYSPGSSRVASVAGHGHTAALATNRTQPDGVVANIPGLRELWQETLGDPRICVAILDGPVDRSHPSLAAADLMQLQTVVSREAAPGPAQQHGTHVASVIFGDHGGPVKGIAPRCKGLIVPVFMSGYHREIAPCSQVDLARAIDQAALAGANVINISGGEFTYSGTAHPLLANAVRACAGSGVLIVAAAGNEGCDCLNIPGALPSVLVVGAMDARGEPMLLSNWGELYRRQGVLAPGENILGADPGGDAVAGCGTSYAAAVVSGVCALLLSLQLKAGRKPDCLAVRSAILNSAKRCDEQPTSDCRRLLAGRLDIPGATLLIKKGVNAMPEIAEALANNSTDTDTNSAVETTRWEPAPSQGQPARYVENRTAEPITGSPTTAGTDSETEAGTACESPPKVKPAGCDCGRKAAPQLVFAFGQLGYDFGTEARRDSIMQQMGEGANPYDPNQLLSYLDKNPSDAAAILWTLHLDATSIYAIQGQGPFASQVYARLREFLKAQVDPEQRAEQVSVPGYIMSTVRLLNGQVVPVIWPELRGMFNWTTAALVNAVCGKRSSREAKGQEAEAYTRKCEAVRNFLERVYHELRNLGTTPQDRAINFSATNAFNVTKIFESALKDGLDLDTIEVERSPICRPESDCWDVKLTFFNPRKVFEQARKVYRFTVDVSDVVPVTIGDVRSWFVR